MIEQIEIVSSHFGYTEEYVLDRTPEWIRRKYVQAAKEKHEAHRMNVLESFKGIALMIDSVANKGKSYDKIMPPPFDEFMDQLQEKKESKNEYIEGEWWAE